MNHINYLVNKIVFEDADENIDKVVDTVKEIFKKAKKENLDNSQIRSRVVASTSRSIRG